MGFGRRISLRSRWGHEIRMFGDRYRYISMVAPVDTNMTIADGTFRPEADLYRLGSIHSMLKNRY